MQTSIQKPLSLQCALAVLWLVCGHPAMAQQDGTGKGTGAASGYPASDSKKADIRALCPSRPNPEFPRSAVNANITGTVVAEARIADGRVQSVRFISGPDVYYASVRNAMLQYGCVAGVGEAFATQEFVFKIDSDRAAEAGSAGAAPPAGSDPSAQFNAALTLLRQADFPAARDAFTHYTKSFPAGSLTLEAYFWKGNSHYALREYDDAISAMREVTEAPSGRYAPDALMIIAASQFESGNANAGRFAAEQVIEKYPRSEAAARARRILKIPPVPQTSSLGITGSYASRVAMAIKRNIHYESSEGNPVVEVVVRVAQDGSILERTVTKPSDTPAWDAAILRAIDNVKSLPLDIDGRIPQTFVLVFRPQ